MKMTSATMVMARNFVLFFIFLLGWFALCTQFYFAVFNSKAAFIERIINFFSYFTILTNLLVTFCCTVLLISRNSFLYKFFSNYNTLTAIAVYILVVAMVYNIVLAPLQHLQGLSKLLSEIFHLIIPVCFLFYWFTFKPKQNIEWQKTIPWLIYPSLYFIYTLIHGSISNFYPYPFINANKLGMARATINGLITIFTFFLLSLVLTGIGNYVSKKVSTVDE